MNAIEFVKKHGIDNSSKYLDGMHTKATHFYVGYADTALYFYKHENKGWCEVDKRTTGWDSDRCCYDMNTPVSVMLEISELKQIVEAFELVESYGGLKESNYFVQDYSNDASDIYDLKQAINLVEQCQ